MSESGSTSDPLLCACGAPADWLWLGHDRAECKDCIEPGYRGVIERDDIFGTERRIQPLTPWAISSIRPPPDAYLAPAEDPLPPEGPWYE